MYFILAVGTLQNFLINITTDKLRFVDVLGLMATETVLPTTA